MLHSLVHLFSVNSSSSGIGFQHRNHPYRNTNILVLALSKEDVVICNGRFFEFRMREGSSTVQTGRITVITGPMFSENRVNLFAVVRNLFNLAVKGRCLQTSRG